MIDLAAIHGATAEQTRTRLTRPDAGRWLQQVEKARHCSNPVRLVGSSERVDVRTGEVTTAYTSAGEPDGVTYVRCGNRRAAVCPSCSHEYQGDVWHLLMAGAAGGMKDVPAEVSAHPLLFVTLTAPSFGPVHAAKKPGRSGSRRCRPRSGGGRKVCPHGRPVWCMAVHDHHDSQVGQPLCADCYDYAGHLVWQWHAPELWRRFTIALRRRLAARLGLSEAATRRLVRVQFAKVAEFQRRGVIHFHALVRLDGVPRDDDAYPAPAVQFEAAVLADLVRLAAGSVSYTAAAVDSGDGRRVLRFGAQVDVRSITSAADRDDPDGGQLHPQTVAAYVAKYATKAAGDIGPADGRGPNAHLARLRDTVRQLAIRAGLAGRTDHDQPYTGWRRWSDMLGFRGHFASKSRRYSTTLGRLRQARRDHAVRADRTASSSADPIIGNPQDQGDDEFDTTLVIGSWRFAGMGWLTAGDAALAAASAARARDD